MKITKKLLYVTLALVLALSSISSAFACTGLYVGSEVSANGSTYMGRSEDMGDLYGKVFGVEPAKDWEEGAMYTDAYGFSMPYPSHTYAYTYVRDSVNYGETVTTPEGVPSIAYAEIGQNEKGVSVTATVSTGNNAAAKAADPLVSTGICEISVTSILLGSAATAKEAVDLLADVIDTYGAGECNSLMISDSSETWYFEIVSGHQYAAIKMPADKVSAQPNIMLLGVIDVTDTENVVVSENLVKLAEDNGFLVTDENGNINVSKTYGGVSSVSSRYWQGVNYVNEELAASLTAEDVTLLFDSTKQLTTLDVLQWLAYRGEGSAMDSNANPSIGAIGNNRQTECHVVEIRPNMPDQLATIQWQAMADAEFSIYIPYYTALITEVHDGYDSEVIPSKGTATDSINYNFQLINNLCYNNRADYPNLITAVKEYFEEYQQSLIDQQAQIDQLMLEIYAYDPALASQKATELGKDLAGQVLEMSTSVLAEIQDYLAAGDASATLTLTAAANDVLPVYSFDNIGGTGLPAPEVDDTTDDENDDENESLGSPNTGDSFQPLLLGTVALVSLGGVVFLTKKKHA